MADKQLDEENVEGVETALANNTDIEAETEPETETEEQKLMNAEQQREAIQVEIKNLEQGRDLNEEKVGASMRKIQESLSDVVPEESLQKIMEEEAEDFQKRIEAATKSLEDINGKARVSNEAEGLSIKRTVEDNTQEATEADPKQDLAFTVEVQRSEIDNVKRIAREVIGSFQETNIGEQMPEEQARIAAIDNRVLASPETQNLKIESKAQVSEGMREFLQDEGVQTELAKENRNETERETRREQLVDSFMSRVKESKVADIQEALEKRKAKEQKPESKPPLSSEPDVIRSIKPNREIESEDDQQEAA